jgi:hypothetical protein
MPGAVTPRITRFGVASKADSRHGGKRSSAITVLTADTEHVRKLGVENAVST